MTEETRKDVTARSQTQAPARQSGRREIDLLPPVDIYEDDNGIVLKADIPGVRGDDLELNVDGQVLSIEGGIHVDVPEALRASFAEMRGTRYARRFTLSKELDAERIKADVGDGVLTLQIPKKEALKPRKIQVQSS